MTNGNDDWRKADRVVAASAALDEAAKAWLKAKIAHGTTATEAARAARDLADAVEAAGASSESPDRATRFAAKCREWAESVEEETAPWLDQFLENLDLLDSIDEDG